MSSSVNIDFNREERIGFKEVVYAGHKTVDALRDIISQYQAKKSSILITHLQVEKFEALKDAIDICFYDALSKIAVVGAFETNDKNAVVGILSAGTSDEGVVNEAYYTLQYMGVSCQKIQDIGVAGIHRFTNKLDEIRKFKILIVVAGFEGALASVAGGLLSQPIIAVPTSVGYGVAEGGKAALNAMLTSCANGLTVVNIDNGYGAAMAAKRMVQTFL